MILKITIKLFATLRQGRFKVEEQEYPAGTSVVNVIDKLSIPHTELGIIFLNGKHTELDTVLNEQDVLAVFPPVGGG
ncbi:MAG TPA: MoaD/ThiS family protein [Syntrophomonadaceae bacterium]|nr:MoaD/ThiS family protein [Syntrophomonadaceae bacterium]